MADVYEIPVKLIINGLEPNLCVEVPSPELPAQLQAKHLAMVKRVLRVDVGEAG
ncbi:unnamed protein product [Effrenium voratum]|nr:unnamed protein product [Effrenium voratum]